MTLRFTHTYNWTSTTPETPFIPLMGLGRADLFLTERPENGTGILGDVLLAIQSNEEIAYQVAWVLYSSESLLVGGDSGRIWDGIHCWLLGYCYRWRGRHRQRRFWERSSSGSMRLEQSAMRRLSETMLRLFNGVCISNSSLQNGTFEELLML